MLFTLSLTFFRATEATCQKQKANGEQHFENFFLIPNQHNLSWLFSRVNIDQRLSHCLTCTAGILLWFESVVTFLLVDACITFLQLFVMFLSHIWNLKYLLFICHKYIFFKPKMACPEK